jgi:hypothetical protein
MPGHTINKSTGIISERWKTTSGALEDVARGLAGGYDTAARLSNMKARKQANNQTSINFGNESINYISDAAETQLACKGGLSAEDRNTQKERIKKMKADLTLTNFKLGDEVPEYVSINSTAMGEANRFKGVGRVTMNTELKEAVKKSSLHFGNEPVRYETVGQDSMKYHGNTNNEYATLKREVQEQTATLRKHNFSFGDEAVLYESDYQRGYGSLPVGACFKDNDKKLGMKAIIEDSRACHFTLGQDQVLYQSNNMRASESIIGKSAGADLNAQTENAKRMKAALQRTSIVIGDDENYV